MVFDTGGYGSIRSVYHEILRGVPVPVVHQTPQVFHQASYNGVLFLSVDYKMQQDGKLGQMWTVIPLRVNDLLEKLQ